MICIMSFSAINCWNWCDDQVFRLKANRKHTESSSEPNARLKLDKILVQRLAIPQIILATLAVTNYHVQIITRLSSGYPVWYWWTAMMVFNNTKVKIFAKHWDVGRIVIRWMVLYALIQGGLFASFLPPA